jgi:redox-sensitive bicupin YhaK (pirin superfamily)
MQFWIALPKNKEQMEPEFVHLEKETLPCWNDGDVSYKLIAGEALGKKSPVQVYSKLFFIEVKTKTEKSISICRDLYGEAGMYILEGILKSEDSVYKQNQLVVPEERSTFKFEMGTKSTVYIIGGNPFPEERFIFWNFVSSQRELIDKAKEKWSAQQFPKIPGEIDFIPLPVNRG